MVARFLGGVNREFFAQLGATVAPFNGGAFYQ
jgi:hypothetical protein